MMRLLISMHALSELEHFKFTDDLTIEMTKF